MPAITSAVTSPTTGFGSRIRAGVKPIGPQGPERARVRREGSGQSKPSSRLDRTLDKAMATSADEAGSHHRLQEPPGARGLECRPRVVRLAPSMPAAHGPAPDQDDRVPSGARLVFVSYCREDAEWLRRFAVMLKPEVRERGVEVWTDTQIGPSREWRPRLTRRSLAPMSRCCSSAPTSWLRIL